MASITELDSLEIIVIVDNEVDPISKYHEPVQAFGNIGQRGVTSKTLPSDRGPQCHEFRMDQLCCGAHGLSLMVTGVVGDKRRTVLFDTSPEELVWEMNVKRLDPDIASIDHVVLSHWHRDHSGGMLKAIKLINEAKSRLPTAQPLTVDLHPNRPDYRGFMTPTFVVSLEADPTFEEVEAAGGKVLKSKTPHSILDDMFLVSGEIPRRTAYEQGIRQGLRFDSSKKEWYADPLIMDERFLMCNLKGRGLVMFTGCSHAGVVNASRHALELGHGAPLYAVVGGYHLADAEAPQMEETVKDLKALKPRVLMPGHCSGWRIKVEIERAMPGCLAPSTVGTRFTL